ncbi:MAG TPA: FAD-dependent oxidoreductase [Bacillota bacterium]|jgi:NADPH-dependent 2,4-dienoyl-CoA reductase/sulfur reductase-like enzyme|nr:FAD-dependent oxidoreductase [Fastidiosipila sp.]HPX93047.1 FAD-dependent oxidoreductase [Bacillota bacterium]HQB80880.1 FAD-dependent oxidoreductase [Bacillota bacterium]
MLVIGGGPAGLGAAISAKENGLSRILVVERDLELGGILNQCVHNGFGLHYFGEELTGPEYAGRMTGRLEGSGIEILCDTMVLSIHPGQDVHRVCLMSACSGYRCLDTETIVLAMGCRERTRGAIGIPGTRAAGILTAGTAQRYVNMEGYMVGKRVIVLGSGDIGLIMARRMTLEGAKVLACVEIMPFSGGLARNIVQCLDDYGIPLLLSHTITEIGGRSRVERVTVQQVDASLQPVEGTERYFDVDTVLLSVGLIPENELTREAGIAMDPRTGGPLVFENKETSIRGIFACGNVLQVHDLVDYVTEESEEAGKAAAAYVLGKATAAFAPPADRIIDVTPGKGIACVIPQKIRLDRLEEKIRFFFRVSEPSKTPKRVMLGDGERVAASFRRPWMAPGEMEHIKVDRSTLQEMQGEILLLTIED